ncbi:hypothetical protein AALO_G00128550 [Alosa alosa]|uniref:Uncharacterized protein n=1 Tax=Alosa alosa TaxID=278164 RepID=A0AAV6GTJ2_9TELE|nr:hypothetical protein AALO_G00128550 [Alosa alosa]
MERLDDSLKKQWWHLTNTFYVETPEGNREQYASVKLVTYIQRYCGGIVHVSFRIETEANFHLEMDGIQMVEISKTFQEITISTDGRVSTTERTQTFIPSLLLSLVLVLIFLAQTLLPVLALPLVWTRPVVLALLVLALQLFSSTGLEDFSLRLNGLRQAFAVLLTEEPNANFITVAGKMILRTMAALNGQDAGVFQQAFDQLVAFAQTPGHETELLVVQIHSVNLLDVIFEMVFFRELEGARARLAPRVQGGFLDHLVTIIHAFLPSEAWPPQAVQCWGLLRADLLGFLKEVFSLEQSVYSQPQDLSDGLFNCLEQHVDEPLGWFLLPPG